MLRTHKTYAYCVVTTNGHGVHGPNWPRCSQARAHMEKVASAWLLDGDVFEVERIEWVDRIGGSRRYQMRQGSRWVPWDPKRDHTVRKPDWFAVSNAERARKEFLGA